MNNKSGLQGAAPAGAFRRPTAVRRLLGRRWVLSPRRGETLLVMPNAANHLQGPMLAAASITGFAGISHFTLRQYRIILSADTASEVRQMLGQKRR